MTAIERRLQPAISHAPATRASICSGCRAPQLEAFVRELGLASRFARAS